MAQFKNQHYVPKLLLRNFSTDNERKQINIFNADTKYYKQHVSLKEQGKDTYFYGNDLKIEKMLGKLEDDAAPAIKEVIKTRQIPKKESEAYGHVFFFIMLQAYRTKRSAEYLNELVNKTVMEIAKHESSLAHIDIDNYEFRFDNPAAESIMMAARTILWAHDLELTLLVNNTNTKFILSDNPSVLYNQFLEKRNHIGGHIGIMTKGLQVFCPVSPEVMFVFYDKWAYKFGNKKDRVINITNTKDIDQLNFMQIVNCYEMIFSNNNISKAYMEHLSTKAEKVRSNELTKMYEINERYTDSKGEEHIQYTHHSGDKKIKLDLSFVKQPQGAKSYKMSGYVVELRDERMRKMKRR